MTAAARSRAAGEEFDAVADRVHRLAALLAAGLEPLRAVRTIEQPSAALAAAAACASPSDVPAALVEAAGDDAAGRAWAVLAAAWAVAIESGAPLAAALERIADSLRSIADADRQVDLAIAGPVATARIVTFLPLLGLAMGLLIGADPFTVLFGTVPGALAGAAGVALLWAGIRWNRRLVAAARVHDQLAGLGAELLAVSLEGGGAPADAVRLVEKAVRRCGLGGPPAGFDVGLETAHETLAFAQRAGVAVTSLLRSDAAHARRIALTHELRRAAMLGSRLLAPLGVCFLPAFVLIGVMPLLIGILRSTLGAFAA